MHNACEKAHPLSSENPKRDMNIIAAIVKSLYEHKAKDTKIIRNSHTTPHEVTAT